MSVPRQSTEPPSGTPGRGTAPGDAAGDLVRWAAFGCVLVPLVLLWCGDSLAGAAATALGLAAVTGACRLLIGRSERCAARERGAGSRSGRKTPGG
ncbi:hypothetical protein [Streptomyces sp. NPDC018947]|uniref:hypothetical protein n=1 Tax=Streptomyces sp. NPDC018947 TaxID=3365054 RepID=UPI0037BDA4BD